MHWASCSHVCILGQTLGEKSITNYNASMATIPRPQCNHYQCKAPTLPGSGFCADHAPAKRANHAKRASDREYNGPAWASIRARQLSIQPLCMACMQSGRIAPALHVDHVFPWKRFGPHAFTANIFQSLCGPCHSTKTALENRGIFRHYCNPGPVDYAPGQYQTAMQSAND